MATECKVRNLQLQVANIYIRVCGDEAEISISPIWDVIFRHEYVAIGKVDEVLNELKQLAEEILKAVEELQKMRGGKQ
jgi:hypothetical protein